MMSKCQRCESKRVAYVLAKASDRHAWSVGNNESSYGYLPTDMGIGGGDETQFDYCLNCGQLQGQFPLPTTKTETSQDKDSDE